VKNQTQFSYTHKYPMLREGSEAEHSGVLATERSGKDSEKVRREDLF